MDIGDDLSSRRLGTAEIDPAAGTLSRGGQVVAVRAKTWNLLVFLSRNQGRVLSKDEIFATVWPGVVVTENALDQGIRDARRAIGDEAGEIIRTVPRRGYLVGAAANPTAPSPTLASRLGGEPMVAVLPFEIIDDAPFTRVEADALAEEISDALAHFRVMAPVARHSAQKALVAAGGDLIEAGRRLGADYLVDGAVRRRDGGVRFTIALTALSSGRRVSAESVDSGSDGHFSAADFLTRRIAATIVHGVEAAELERVRIDPSVSAEAYPHLIRGIALLRSYGEEDNEAAREQLRRAVELDPHSGLALSYLALAEVIVVGYQDGPREVLSAARDLALRAIALSPGHPRCHRILGLILSFLGSFPAAENHLRKAFELNPYDADTLAQLGYVMAKRGIAEQGLAFMERALIINPLYPSWYNIDLSTIMFGLGRYNEAADAIERIPTLDVWSHYRLAACRVMAGDATAASAAVRAARALDPSADPWTYVERLGYEKPADAERFRLAMELALASADASSDFNVRS